MKIPVPKGLSYLPFQLQGTEFALNHPNCLLADEMGLGKTVQAIGLVNACPDIETVLIVCPASLRLNWFQEWQRWSTRKRLKAGIADGEGWPDGNVVIISYEGLDKYFRETHGRTWSLIIVDESHKLKSATAKRTANLLGSRRWDLWQRRWIQEIPPVSCSRKLFLSGTPMPNRPVELWTTVYALDPSGLGRSKSQFEQRYCDGHMEWLGYGRKVWNKDGASNLAELSERMKQFTIRRTKAQVLPQLPSKREQVIVLETPPKLRKLLEKEKREYEKLEQARLSGVRVPFTEMSRLRQQTALAKVPYVITQVQDTLEETEKLVVMCHHQAVIDAIAESFEPGEFVIVDGRTPVTKRQAAVNRFQHDPTCRIFLSSIQAGGFGFTLTAASTVLFAELDWTPGNIAQAEDRLHRIGQKRSVLVLHIVLDGSLDSNLVKKLTRKQRVIDETLAAVCA